MQVKCGIVPLSALVIGRSQADEIAARIMKGGFEVTETYYVEENSTVDRREYEELRAVALKLSGKTEPIFTTVRKLRFQGETQDEQNIRYYVCMEDYREDKIYIEKKVKTDDRVRKQCQRISKAECDKLLHGDIAWMKEHSMPLLDGFYDDIQKYAMRSTYLTEYCRELIDCGCYGTVIFNSRVLRAVGKCEDMFSRNLVMINCIDEGDYYTNFKCSCSELMPTQNMLHIPDEQYRKLVFA